ncbi:MAG: MSMEG_4193 family putative phosphomutase [Pseudonocardiaceae bacterium]
MTTLLLVRHGRTQYNAGHALAGWTPGVGLDETGREQAAGLARRLRGSSLAAVVTSPLQRCLETVAALRDHGVAAPAPTIDDRFGECRYGDWTGRELKELRAEPAWHTVQHYPSAAVFPDGEGLADVQSRATTAIRDWRTRVRAEHGEDAIWLVCSHEDVIKTVVADVIGLHLDLFQRITVSNAAVTAVRFTLERPYLLRLNDSGTEALELGKVKVRAGQSPPKNARSS